MAQELKAETIVPQGSTVSLQMYAKGEVDAVLAEKDATIAELKQQLESVQASMDADLIDAGMENRKLKHALWLARAATAKHLVTTFENYDYLGVYKLNIKQESARTWMTCKLRTPAEWIKVWSSVEIKCLKKAENY